MPGCSGKGERKTDYCYDPTLAESIEATIALPGTTELRKLLLPVSIELSFDCILMYIIYSTCLYNSSLFRIRSVGTQYNERMNPRRTNRVRVKEKMMMSPPKEKIPRRKRMTTRRSRMVLLGRGGKK